ncbi:MAG: hypothetical protein OXH75_13125, partial [Acidobacteria bacterium]|nr:hypothetical protein [Acidobacteriota bacterium]
MKYRRACRWRALTACFSQRRRPGTAGRCPQTTQSPAPARRRYLAPWCVCAVPSPDFSQLFEIRDDGDRY